MKNRDNNQPSRTEVFYAVLLFVSVIIALFYIVAIGCAHMFQDVFNHPTEKL